MEKAIFYEEQGGWLHKCMFAGLDNNKPQWLIMESGLQVMTQEEFTINLGLGEINYDLLCEQGETVTSTDMAKMMGSCLNLKLEHLDWRFELQAKTLKKLGVEWSQKPLKFCVRIYSNCQRGYSMTIQTVDDVENEDVVWKDDIRSFDEAIAYAIAYLGGLSVSLNIKNTAELVICKEDRGKLSDFDKKRFNDIITY